MCMCMHSRTRCNMMTGLKVNLCVLNLVARVHHLKSTLIAVVYIEAASEETFPNMVRVSCELESCCPHRN